MTTCTSLRDWRRCSATNGRCARPRMGVPRSWRVRRGDPTCPPCLWVSHTDHGGPSRAGSRGARAIGTSDEAPAGAGLVHPQHFSDLGRQLDGGGAAFAGQLHDPRQRRREGGDALLGGGALVDDDPVLPLHAAQAAVDDAGLQRFVADANLELLGGGLEQLEHDFRLHGQPTLPRSIRGATFLSANRTNPPRGGSASEIPYMIGSMTRKAAPPRSDRATRISPRCWSTMLRTIGNPSPVPLPSDLVVKNGSKILSRSSSATPCPESAPSSNTVDGQIGRAS